MNIWSKIRGAFRTQRIQSSHSDASVNEASEAEGTGPVEAVPVPLLPPPSGDQAEER
jgi:hypothetical protein